MLCGFVLNDSSGVLIEAQGPADRLRAFADALLTEAPPLAAITRIHEEARVVDPQEQSFEIRPSDPSRPAQATVTVDTALCDDCLAELLSGDDRRAGYGLINCTNCGPRYTILRRVPYDRPNTTMAEFAMCPRCRAEYESSADRRFHAQPIACHDCGPRVTLVSPDARPIAGDPYRNTAELLRRGKLIAIKGLGGFHLACRADLEQAVARLRQSKQRDAKPFALMCRSVAAARRLVELSDAAAELMQSPACPIVLARRRVDANLAPSVAPGNHRLGVMLPYTPIHHLLFAQPDLGPLVMTSGNVSDQPLIIDNQEAQSRLGAICDALLWHDRPIQRPVDDSVLIDMGGRTPPLPIRRARGYVPAGIAIDGVADACGLSLGAELKSTIGVLTDAHAVLSHHLGDIVHPRAFICFKRAIDDLCDLTGAHPQWIAHDLHPMYLSTRYARELSQRLHVPLIGVQHHHAHAAAVMAEHGVTGPVLAVVCDGAGYGTDQTTWGGELLLAHYATFKRLARLRPMSLPGGDAAARQTWRCGLAMLRQAVGDSYTQHPLARRLAPDANRLAMIVGMFDTGTACVPSTGAGRVFDAVAAILGLCTHNLFEAQAAMALEAAADGHEPPHTRDLFDLTGSDLRQIDLSPLVREIAACAIEPTADVGALSALFHEQFAAAWEQVVLEASQTTGLQIVALSGGVFCNQRLTQSLTRRLEARGMRVLRHRLVPPNDGGLALGQVAVAAAIFGARQGGA